MKTVTEGKASISIKEAGKISKEMEVFYNPSMKTNRDIAVLLLNALPKKVRAADIMAGSGIRSIRMILETNKIEKIHINDLSSRAFDLIKENLELNKISNEKYELQNEDANIFLLKSSGFDYIDLDPFGTPIQFIESATARISRGGIIAVTATDTSALSGTFRKACLRKYWAEPLRNYLMHEIGIRILIRRCQLAGTEYDKALIPIFSHSTLHYMRIYFKCKKGKKEVDKMLKKHKYFHYSNSEFTISDEKTLKKGLQIAGPLWAGELWNKSLAKKLAKKNKNEELSKFLSVIKEESEVNEIGFYSLHKLASKLRCSSPKKEEAIDSLKSKGFKASRTHFSPDGIRTDAPLREIEKILKFYKS